MYLNSSWFRLIIAWLRLMANYFFATVFTYKGCLVCVYNLQSQNFSISSENLTTVGQTTTTVAPLVTSVQMSSEKWSTVHRRPTTVAEVTSQRFISPVTTSGRSFSSSAPVPLSSPCNTTCFVAITVILVVVVVVVVVVMWFFIRRRRSLRLRQPETLPMPDTLNGSTQREPEAEQLPQPPLVTAPPSPMVRVISSSLSSSSPSPLSASYLSQGYQKAQKPIELATNKTAKRKKRFLLVFDSNFVSKTQHFWDIRLQKCCDLENRVRGPWRSLETSSFDRAHMTSYRRSIVTIALSRVVSEIFNVE